MMQKFKQLFRGILVLLLSVSFVFVCVHQSERVGRLMTAPNYDDCTYLLEGSLLLNGIKNNGLVGVSNFLEQRGLHSPYSVLLAATSYGLFGFSATAPYFGNVIVVLAYLAGIGWFLRRLPLAAQILGLMLFLSPPFITMGVVEFRPDIAWATVTGFGVVWIITNESIFRYPARAALGGVLFGLALLTKPSTFAMTGLLFTGACLSRGICYVISRRNNEIKRDPWMGISSFLVALLIIIEPYAYSFGMDAWRYFWDNSFGVNKEIWIYHGGQIKSLFYYMSGISFASNIAISGIIITLISLPCAIYLLTKRTDLRLKITFIFTCIGATLFINTVAEMKSPFLGGGIYGVWLFGSAYVMGEAYYTHVNLCDKSGYDRCKKLIFLMLCAILVAAVSLYNWPAYSNWKKYRSYFENYRLADEHIKRLLESRVNNAPKSILFTQAGPIVMENVGLWYSFRNISVDINSATFCRTEKEFTELYPKYQWVLVQEQGIIGHERNMPSEVIMPRLLDIIKIDPNYHVISEFTASDGKKVWIYARR